jgi:transposase-like protein
MIFFRVLLIVNVVVRENSPKTIEMHKNSYTIAKKLSIIRLALESTVKIVSTKTRIHQSIIYRWIGQKVILEQATHKSTVHSLL